MKVDYGINNNVLSKLIFTTVDQHGSQKECPIGNEGTTTGTLNLSSTQKIVGVSMYNQNYPPNLGDYFGGISFRIYDSS